MTSVSGAPTTPIAAGRPSPSILPPATPLNYFIRQKERLPQERLRSYRQEHEGDNEGDASPSSDETKGISNDNVVL